MADSELPSRLDLHVGEERAFTLPGMGASGYVWQDHVIGPAGVIRIMWERGVAPPPETPLPPGKSAPETLRIQALARGEVTLNLAQERSWEPNAKPLQTHSLLISVR